MMINTIIMNLLGNKSYKKYVSIASGMILVLIVVSPLIKVFKLQENLDYFLESNTFTMDTSDFKNKLSQVEEDQNDKIYSEYKGQIKKQVKELLLQNNVYLKSMDVQIDSKTDSTTYGQILKMNIKATTEDSSQASGENLNIDKVDIGQISINKDEKQKESELPTPLEISIKNKLSDFYNIEQGNINISIQGG